MLKEKSKRLLKRNKYEMQASKVAAIFSYKYGGEMDSTGVEVAREAGPGP